MRCFPFYRDKVGDFFFFLLNPATILPTTPESNGGRRMKGRGFESCTLEGFTSVYQWANLRFANFYVNFVRGKCADFCISLQIPENC